MWQKTIDMLGAAYRMWSRSVGGLVVYFVPAGEVVLTCLLMWYDIANRRIFDIKNRIISIDNAVFCVTLQGGIRNEDTLVRRFFPRPSVYRAWQ